MGPTPNPGRVRPHLGATIAACTFALVTLLAATHVLTRGFETWTYDGRRALDLQQGGIAARPLALMSSRGESLEPWSGAPASPDAYLVDFIYTSCPSVCQVLGSEFARMQGALQEAGAGPSVRLLSVSFDLERDDRAALAAYAGLHRADGQSWVVAAPRSADELDRLLRDLQVIVVPDGNGGYVHNGAIHLLDAHGTLRGLFGYDEWQEALAAARRLAESTR